MIKYIGELGDLYNNDDIPSNNVGRISNSLQYRWVKAYPSVNSTNGGGINSEENLRWLTKQFTQKSFLIPRPNSDTKDEFNYTGTHLNAGQATGGMANIDGYIFNIANDIKMMSYDSEGASMIGTDAHGYIGHQNLQFVKKNFIRTDNGYLSSDINEYLLNGEDDTEDLRMDTSLNPDWKTKWYDLEPFAEKSPQYVGSVTLYYDKIITNQVDWVNVVKDNTPKIDPVSGRLYMEPVQDWSVVDELATITYSIYYGNCDYPKIKCIYPVIYFKDVFGFSYIFDSSLTATSSTYPGTQFECIDMLGDTFTPSGGGGDDPKLNRKTVTGIYDTTTMYSQIEEDGSVKSFVYDTEGHTSPFCNRDNSLTPTHTAISTNDLGVLGNAFTIIHDYDLISIYKEESPDTDIPNFLTFNICKYYYCLPIAKLVDGMTNILQLRQEDSTRYIPITFMGADGILYPTNIENENSEDNLPVAEGYTSFIRRICKQLVVDDDNYMYTSPLSPLYYGNQLYTNEHTESWAKLFRYLERHGANATQYVLNNWSTLQGIFGVEYYSDLTFSVVYNKIIAPYINFYTQLSWSSLYDNIVNTNELSNGSFKSFCAGSVLDYSLPEIVKVDSNYAQVTNDYSITTDNTTNPPTVVTTTKTARYPIREYTDKQRFSHFAYNISAENVGSADDDGRYKLSHRIPLSTINMNDCEDLINFIKKCTNADAKINKTGSKVYSLIAIPYKLTTLSITSNVYGFNMFNGMADRCAKYYTYKVVDGVDNTKVTRFAKSGYIQNVKIDLSTMIPDREFYVQNSTETSRGYEFMPSDNTFATASMDFNLRLGKNVRWDYEQHVLHGTDGFNFETYSQGWASYVPTVFELFKNSQNHLLGKDKTTSEHAGIDINFKFPMLIDETDLWFTNQWLSNIKTITAWEIETSGTNYPTNTDGMIPYLDTRNSAKFPLDAIYTTVDGDIIAIPEWINSQLNDDLAIDYADRINVGNFTYMYRMDTYNGFSDNIKRLKQYVDDTNWTVFYKSGSSTTTVYMQNNEYQTIDNAIVSKLTIRGTRLLDSPAMNGDNFNNGLNTAGEHAHVLNTTLKVSFNKKCEVLLDTILNPATNSAFEGNDSTNYLPIIWSSNYPIETIENYAESGETNKRTAYKLILRDLYNVETTEALLEIRIVPSEDETTAFGYCKISMISNPNTLTEMDASYLVKELYNLETVTWNQVSEATQAGFAQRLWEVGDTKTFTITNGEGDEYTVSAMIIGFNQDGENTITWMTNLYNNGENSIPPTDTILYKKFNADFDVVIDGGETIANNQDGYDTTDVYRWLNVDMVNNGYIEEDLFDIIKPVNKNSGILYLMNSNVGYKKNILSYYKDNLDNILRTSKFWLPSIFEMGIDTTLIDSIENTALVYAKAHPATVDTSTYKVNEVNSLRGNCNMGDVALDAPSKCYDYFKKDTQEQNVKSVTMLSRSFYAVSDSNSSTILSNRFTDVSEMHSDFTTFSAFPRAMYCVGTGYDTNTTSGRWFTVLDRDDVYDYLDNQVLTDFCFVTQ